MQVAIATIMKDLLATGAFSRLAFQPNLADAAHHFVHAIMRRLAERLERVTQFDDITVAILPIVSEAKSSPIVSIAVRGTSPRLCALSSYMGSHKRPASALSAQISREASTVSRSECHPASSLGTARPIGCANGMRAAILNIDLSCCCDPCGSGLESECPGPRFSCPAAMIYGSVVKSALDNAEAPEFERAGDAPCASSYEASARDTLGVAPFGPVHSGRRAFKPPDRIDCAPTEEKKCGSSSRAHSKRAILSQALLKRSLGSMLGRSLAGRMKIPRAPLSRRGSSGRSCRDWRERACFTARASSRPAVRTAAVAEFLPRAKPSRASSSPIYKR